MNQRLNTRATGLTRSLIAAALLATTGLAAQAHQVWLEHSGSQAKLHFGEYNDNVRETSPGLLDKFSIEGAEVTEIMVKVQPNHVAAQQNSRGRAPALASSAKADLRRLAGELPADSPLKAALERLVRRSR